MKQMLVSEAGCGQIKNAPLLRHNSERNLCASTKDITLSPESITMRRTQINKATHSHHKYCRPSLKQELLVPSLRFDKLKVPCCTVARICCAVFVLKDFRSYFRTAVGTNTQANHTHKLTNLQVSEFFRPPLESYCDRCRRAGACASHCIFSFTAVLGG